MITSNGQRKINQRSSLVTGWGCVQLNTVVSPLAIWFCLLCLSLRPERNLERLPQCEEASRFTIQIDPASRSVLLELRMHWEVSSPYRCIPSAEPMVSFAWLCMCQILSLFRRGSWTMRSFLISMAIKAAALLFSSCASRQEGSLASPAARVLLSWNSIIGGLASLSSFPLISWVSLMWILQLSLQLLILNLPSNPVCQLWLHVNFSWIS